MVTATTASLLIAITLLCHIASMYSYVYRIAVEVRGGGSSSPLTARRTHIASSRRVELMEIGSIQRPNRSDWYANDVMMRTRRWGGPVVGPLLRRLSIVLVCILSVVVLRVFNRFRVIRESTLKHLIFDRPTGKGLLTVSNHQSVVDDPGLWGALLPFWRITPEQLRWSLCTDDMFFYVSVHHCLCIILYCTLRLYNVNHDFVLNHIVLP